MSGFLTISTVGAKPRITWPQSGSAMAIWMPKQTVMTRNSVTTKASTQRKPSCCIHRIRNTSSAVSSTPISSGMPNRRLSPIAVPITSARSVAQMANSASAQSGHGDIAREGVAAGLRQVAAARRCRAGCRAPATRSPSGWTAARWSAARSRTSSRRRARSPSCRGPCSRRRPDSRGREMSAASATAGRWGASGSSRTLRRARACRLARRQPRS